MRNRTVYQKLKWNGRIEGELKGKRKRGVKWRLVENGMVLLNGY